MAHCTINNGIETITGALQKTTEPVPKLCESGVSKRKEPELTDETGIQCRANGQRTPDDIRDNGRCDPIGNRGNGKKKKMN